MEKIRIENSPSRCPYCHDSVLIKAAVVCKECLARHHDACWREQGKCSTCACTEKLISASVAPVKPAPSPLRFRPRGRVTPGLMGLNQTGLTVFIVLLLVFFPLCFIPWLIPSMREDA